MLFLINKFSYKKSFLIKERRTDVFLGYSWFGLV